MPLPTIPTAPFCPAEVKGSITIDARAPWSQKLRRFAGPGLLVAIGYMDPGNWATDIQAGSEFGYSLLWVVAFSSLAAIFLQMLAARLGLVTGRDLAQASYERYGPFGKWLQWVTAEISIIACDIAEVLGCALAFKLLLGVPLAWGIVLTALDTVIVLGLQGKGFRQIEAIVLGLIGTMAFCFVAQVAMAPPDWHAVAAGLVPGNPGHDSKDAIVLALGIVGATIMPHNLYLHSSVVQTRRVTGGERGQVRDTLAMVRVDTWVSLLVAMCVNAAILILAGSAFHAAGHTGVADIEQAYQLITPLVGGGRGDPVRHRAAGLGAKFDADRHDRRAGDHGRLPAYEDSLLPAPPDHARAGAGAGADRRAGARRRLGRQAAGVEPGAAEPATAVRDVAADPLGQRPPADAGQRDRPARAPVRLAAVRRDHRHQPAAGDGRGGLSGRRRAGFASFGEVRPDDAVDLFPRY